MTKDAERWLDADEQRTIVFYDDELTAVRVNKGETSEIYVPVRRLCDNLGLDWSAQRQRINRHPVMSEAIRGVVVTTTPEDADQHGGRQGMLCLPLEMIPGWLFGINPTRVREEISDKLVRYQREAFKALWDAFKGEILPAVDVELAQPTMAMTPAERALATIEALHTLAKQQVAIERWLAQHDDRMDLVEGAALSAHERLDRAGQMVGAMDQRLRRIELTMAGGATITDAQAAAISEAVKALAFELGKKEPDGGNPYQRVYSELYRKFRVPSYKALLLESFPAVMQWLTEWWQQLTGEEPPFAAGDTGGRDAMD